MGHRTLTLSLVFRALFLDGDAFDELRDDDNPFVEGLFLVALIGAVTALLSLVGQLLAWASLPPMEAIQQAVLDGLKQMSWWPQMSASPQGLAGFLRIWDIAWQVFPRLFGAPDPARGAANLLIWPVSGIVTWLIYGLLAHVFARWLGGKGTLGQTLGTTALAFTPMLLRGLGLVPFLVLGGVANTWLLICRYKAVRSAHGLAWGRAFWATVLPYLLYLAGAFATAGIVGTIIALVMGRTA